MRLAARSGIATALLCTAAWTAGTPQELFEAAREKVLSKVANVPRYTCVETITRTVHHPQYGISPAGCAALSQARSRLRSNGLLVWHDRLRVDVAVAGGSEMFSWAGASSFETSDLAKLAGSGSTGSGAFGSFLSSVFGNDPDRFSYAGERDQLAVFNFSVSAPRSHYTYRMNNGTDRVIPYQGSFYVSLSSGDLKRLVVRATDFPDGEVCEVEDTMDYQTVQIGSGEFLLPEVSRMNVLYESGEVGENQTRFSNCREYVGQSSIRFGDEDDLTPGGVTGTVAALKALPLKTRVRVHLDPPVDTSTAAAGDPVVGIVERDVKENGQVVVHATDKLHGRLVRMEQFMMPQPRWIIAIRFEGIERNGVQQPVKFLPVDDGDRSARSGPGYLRNLALPTEPKGAGIFSFTAAGKLVLDRNFRSEWEVAR